MIRTRDIHFLEENVRHISIEVLPGVNDDLRDIAATRDLTADNGSFNELRARADDADDLQWSYELCSFDTKFCAAT